MILSYKDVSFPPSECTARHWKSARPANNKQTEQPTSSIQLFPHINTFFYYEMFKPCLYDKVHLIDFVIETPTLEFVCCSYDSEYVHVDLSIAGIFFSDPPPHSEEEVAWGEAVSTERMTERVLRSETQLKTSVGVSKGLRDQQETQTGVRLELQRRCWQMLYNSQTPF